MSTSLLIATQLFGPTVLKEAAVTLPHPRLLTLGLPNPITPPGPTAAAKRLVSARSKEALPRMQDDPAERVQRGDGRQGAVTGNHNVGDRLGRRIQRRQRIVSPAEVLRNI